MFSFHLPDSRIARYPSDIRSESKLLCVSRDNPGVLADYRFYELPDLLRAGDVLVINNSKVIPARLLLHKHTGGAVELLFERTLQGNEALALLGSNKPLTNGTLLTHASNEFCVEVGDRAAGALRKVRLKRDKLADWQKVLATHGTVPLPPYMRRKAEKIDSQRYQTSYAKLDGSVAAPTAGLHFDSALFDRLQAKGIGIAELTLHVGYGTFAKVDADATELHPERFSITDECIAIIQEAKARGGRVIAVGTTSVRVLESAAPQSNRTPQNTIQAQQGETRLCIKPGFKFGIVDGMITNFHLSGTSLLWLVSALAGEATIEAAYTHALASEYRFYSYGDAMLIV